MVNKAVTKIVPIYVQAQAILGTGPIRLLIGSNVGYLVLSSKILKTIVLNYVFSLIMLLYLLECM